MRACHTIVREVRDVKLERDTYAWCEETKRYTALVVIMSQRPGSSFKESLVGPRCFHSWVCRPRGSPTAGGVSVEALCVQMYRELSKRDIGWLGLRRLHDD